MKHRDTARRNRFYHCLEYDHEQEGELCLVASGMERCDPGVHYGPELRDCCVMHTGNQVADQIKVGDIFKIGEEPYEILAVGSEVQTNLTNLGHITVKFDGGKGEVLEGSLHVEEAPVPEITPGTEISIERM